ncbi:phage portal protein [Faecalicatena contorta]|uniref:phage portal protein n=1 Tax=Faecalicatena contorta TaxID=39482 RepID=UPI001961E8DC|nr:phage portal protein [Faecalicatena contorta]MBM6686793.1 phage portal protein [Faecalicatena contorta]MBM6709690.1 phage portal protein [Faecalicatena contorta]
MPEYRGIEYLRTKLDLKRTRVLRRYKFYEMKNRVKDFGISTPPELRLLSHSLGWCAKTVDSLADRLVFREFANDNFGMNEIFSMNNPDILFDSAMTSALISSCCFIYISLGDNDFPQLQVIDGGNATGIIDPITGMLTEGYAVLERDDYDEPKREAYFISGSTTYYTKGQKPKLIDNEAPYPLLVPIIHRPDAKRVFGHSRISRACMSIVSAALRTVKRSEIAAEFFSFPQKYAVGLSEDAEGMDKWKATMSALLTISKDEDGDTPQLGQFAQQSMVPHTEQLKMFAAMFAGESGLTMDDLGFSTENPSSADAIKASHENLRLAARKAQRTFGSGLLNVGYLAACLRDGEPYYRNQIYQTKPVWEPIFEPDAAMLSLIGDGAIKINQAVPGYFNKDNLRDQTGIDASKMTTPVETGGTGGQDE